MPHYDEGTRQILRRQARELRSVAKTRGKILKLPPQNDEELETLDKLLSLYSNYPSERRWAFANRIAKYLKTELTLLQAMNEFHCVSFIETNKDRFHSNSPTPDQIKSVKALAKLKGIRLPKPALLYLDEWKKFIEENINRDDRDIVENYLREMNILQSSIELSNDSVFIHYLSKAMLFEESPQEREKEIRNRINESIKSGQHPDAVAEAFDINNRVAWDIADELEAQGYEIRH